MSQRLPLLALIAAFAAGCPAEPPDTGSPDTDVETDSETATGRWSGMATVRVLDVDGKPIEAMNVMIGGAPPDQWVLTDADGMASIDVPDDGISLRMVLAGEEGWLTSGARFSQRDGPDGIMDITMKRLPDEDGIDYVFQPGGDRHSPDTSECGHCHWTIGSDWANSQHRDAARNPKLWDAYLGSSASRSASAETCKSAGGWMKTGQVAGAPTETEERCYTGEGVLPWLHDGCGGVDEPACDHPGQRDDLSRFGSCGDCHSPAVTAGEPGHIDLLALEGLPYNEGVACDFCHKVREVLPGPEPGLDGGIVLHRPSLPTNMPGQQYEPINYGPYADVPVRIMNGSWVPQFREAGWCASCHEHAQPALHPSQTVDPTRWPDGLPVQETWTEYKQSGLDSTTVTCQTCHMPELDEESSTYDITPRGVGPSEDQGWFRALGQVRHHDFAAVEDKPPVLKLTLTEQGSDVEAAVQVRNDSAGHAIPTGEPMRQLIVLVTAEDDRGPVAAVGGQAAPDIAGYSARGEVGVNVTVEGDAVRFTGVDLPAGILSARFVRPTGIWDDYQGTGLGWFAAEGRTAREKGLQHDEFLGEVGVVSVSAGSATLSGTPPDLVAGDVIYVVAKDQWAGHPGWVYAKTLVSADGTRSVPHYRAVDVASDNRLQKGGSGTSTHRFGRTDDTLRVTARLIYRRYADGPAALYGWEHADRELKSMIKEP